MSNCEKIKTLPVMLVFAFHSFYLRKRKVTRDGGILTAIVPYLEATDNVADDFFNGLLKLT